MNNKINKTVEKLFLKLKKLPSNFETSTSELLGKDSLENFSTKDLFDINKQLIKKCEKENIKLNFDKYSKTFVGMPFNIPFTKK